MIMVRMGRYLTGMLHRGQRGLALPIVLILLVLGGLLVVPALQYSSTSLKHHGVTERKAKELYAADSGVEDALYWLINAKEEGGPWAGWDDDAGYGERADYTLNDCTVSVTLERLPSGDGNEYKITSEATSTQASTTVLSTVWAISLAYYSGPSTTFDNQSDVPDVDLIVVEGDATLGTGVDIYSDFIAGGDVTAVNNARIYGDVLAAGDLHLSNNAEIHGTVCCWGNITLGNGALIDGDIKFLGDASHRTHTLTLAESGAGVQGNVWANGTSLTVDIKINAEIDGSGQGNIYAYGLNATHPHHIDYYLRKPNSEITGSLYASGNITCGDDSGTLWGDEHPNHASFNMSALPDCPQKPDSSARVLTWEAQ